MRLALLLLLCCACARRTLDDPPRFAMLTGDGILVVDRGRRRLVPRTKGLTTFCWSADGRSFFATTRERLVRVEQDGSRSPLGPTWKGVRFPQASPDRKLLAFAAQSGEEPRWQLWVLPLPNGEPRHLGPGYSPSWSPDSRTIHYERMEDPGGIGALDLATGRTRIFPESARDGYTPVRSPTGRYLLFSRRGLVLYDTRKLVTAPLTGRDAYERFGSFSRYDRFLLYFSDKPRGIRLRELATGEDRLLDLPVAELAAFAP